MEFEVHVEAAKRSNPCSLAHGSHSLANCKSIICLRFLVFIHLLRRGAWQVNLFSSRIAISPVYSMKMSLYRDETGSLINLSGACLNVIMGFGDTSAILIYLH